MPRQMHFGVITRIPFLLIDINISQMRQYAYVSRLPRRLTPLVFFLPMGCLTRQRGLFGRFSRRLLQMRRTLRLTPLLR